MLQIAAAISLIVGLAPLLGASSEQGAVVTEVPMVVDYVNIPDTIEEATSRADAIVRARIGARQPRNRTVGGTPVPQTVYGLDVVEVLKQDPGLPPPREVVRAGGEVVTARGRQKFVVGSSRVDLQACKLEYSIVSPK